MLPFYFIFFTLNSSALFFSTFFECFPSDLKYQYLTCRSPAVTKYEPSFENDNAFTLLVTLLLASLLPFFQFHTFKYPSC